MYEKCIKRGIDIILSILGFICLSWLFLIISIVIIIDDPGPVLFTQRRVGQGKKIFKLHKFRSMKMSAPHDIPTHLLDNPEQYITRIGILLRKYSLDELPQIWDIFTGKMSIIGPRPALWNQEDLIIERDKYGVNDVRPGLSGWAQINGRDELEIPVKAKLDGEYVSKLKKSNISGLTMDIKCFWGTIKSVLEHDGVVEGGTGEMQKKECLKSVYAELPDVDSVIGFGKPVIVNKGLQKKILVTGADSYIGEYFKRYALEYYNGNFEVDTIDMIDGSWKTADFSRYDVVYHVAGIAHADVCNVSEETKRKYYDVNTDLAIEAARKAKEDGVNQFVFMSSMIVYGDSAPYGKNKVITDKTVPHPDNFYGDSKWQADKGVRALADKDFKVLVLRPPMIYGKGSQGNYKILSKMARKMPVFPNAYNQRSMLYVENLCEFLCQLMLVPNNEFDVNGNVFFPQNEEYTKTSDMVREINKVHGKKIFVSNVLNPIVWLASKVPGRISRLVNKAFGNSCYIQHISKYDNIKYCKWQLSDSISATEKVKYRGGQKILFLVNHDVVIYKFRLELVEQLILEGYDVYISSPNGNHIEKLKKLGCHYYEISMERHGMNPLKEIALILKYQKLIRIINPNIILSYTIKPNIYGGTLAGLYGIPYIANITGLGTAMENGGTKQRIVSVLYKIGLKKANMIYFQNERNLAFMKKHNTIKNNYELLPGSGVNLETNCYEKYPVEEEKIVFLIIGRIMKDKGTDEILEAAKEIKKEYPNVIFRFIGFYDGSYERKINDAVKTGVVEYLGQQPDVHEFIKNSHATIHASYHEGMSNVLLETAATGRPVLATNIPGCIEAFDPGISGIDFKPHDVADMVRAIKIFLNMSFEERREMGLCGRKKMEQQFDRKIVVDKYIKSISTILKG